MAATGTEIERLIVRLVGDASSYRKMLVDAQMESKRAAGVIERVSARIQRVSKSINAAGRAIRNFGSRISSVGRSMRTSLTLPIIGAGAAIFKFGSDFETEMQKIVGLVGVSQKQVNEWKKDLVKMGPELGKTPVELSKALFFVTSAGLRGKKALDALKLSAMGASGGLGDTQVVADAVTSAMNAYAKSGMTAAKATDILVATVREGKAEAASIAPVMGNLLPLASAMSVRFEDVAGSLAAMTRLGADAASAATSISATLMAIQKPGKMAEEALEGTGLSFEMLREMVTRPGGLVKAMQLLNKTFADDEEKLALIIPNVRALRGVMNILSQDAGTVESIMQGVANSTGATQKAFDVASNTARFKFNTAIAELQGVLIKLGGTVIPAIVTAIQHLTSWVSKAAKWWGSLSPKTQKMIVIFAGIAAALGPVIIILGQLITVIGAAISVLGLFLTPAGLVVAAIAAVGMEVVALTVGWKAAWEGIKKYVGAIITALMAGDMKAAAEIMWAGLELVWKQSLLALKEAWVGFKFSVLEIFDDLGTSLKKKWKETTSYLATGMVVISGKLQGQSREQIKAVLTTLQEDTDRAIKGYEQERKGRGTEREAEVGKQMAALQSQYGARIDELKKIVDGVADDIPEEAAKEGEKAGEEAGRAMGTSWDDELNKKKPGLETAASVTDAVAIGSAEAARRLAEYRERQSTVTRPEEFAGGIPRALGEAIGGQPDKLIETGKQTVEILRELLDNARKQTAKLDIAPAPLS